MKRYSVTSYSMKENSNGSYVHVFALQKWLNALRGEPSEQVQSEIEKLFKELQNPIDKGVS